MSAGTWQDRRGVNILDTGAPFYDVYETADGRHMAVGRAGAYSFMPEFVRLRPRAGPARSARRFALAADAGTVRGEVPHENDVRVVGDLRRYGRLRGAGGFVYRGAAAIHSWPPGARS